MAEKKYLDYTGFSYFVEKIKTLLTNKADKTLSNVDSSVFAEKVSASGAGGTPIVTTAGDGAAYTATVPNVTALSVGLTVTIIPHTVSTSTTPTLNLNSLGAKQIRRRLSNMATSQEAGYSASWLASGKPFTVKYDGTYWIVEDMTKPAAGDLYGNLAASKISAGTFAGQVVANASAVQTLTTKQVRNIYAGTEDMTAGTTALATGDIYIVYE